MVIGTVPDRSRIVSIGGMAELGSGTVCAIPFGHPSYPNRSVDVSINTAGQVNLLWGSEVTISRGFVDIHYR